MIAPPGQSDRLEREGGEGRECAAEASAEQEADILTGLGATGGKSQEEAEQQAASSIDEQRAGRKAPRPAARRPERDEVASVGPGKAAQADEAEEQERLHG